MIASIGFILLIEGCSKKTSPNTAVNKTEIKKDTLLVVKNPDSLATAKRVIKKKPKETIPMVIVVNDKFASKSIDGRYYYDLQGHRYWRNNKNGKYYLFNKAMLTDESFKKPE